MLLISWALGLVLFLGRHAIADLYGRPSIAEVMSLLALSFVIAPFGEPASALLTRQMRFRSLHNIGLTSTLVGTSVSISSSEERRVGKEGVRTGRYRWSPSH